MSNSVILLVPLHEPRKPDIDRGPGLEAEIAPRVFDVGKAFGNIAGLQRQQFLARGLPQLSLEHRNKVEKLLGAVIAEVIEAVGDTARYRRRTIMCRDRTRDDVVDIGKVAGHSAFVKDFYRLA